MNNIDLSSPTSSLSLDNMTILPTPPLQEDSSSCRNSNPSGYQSKHQAVSALNTNHNFNEQSFITSGSPLPIFNQIKQQHGIIDKKTKQQLMFAKLSDNNSDRGMFKSFQPPSSSSNNEVTKMNSYVSGIGMSGNKHKKKDLFRSNVEPTNSSSGGGMTGLYYGGYGQNI